MKSGGEWVVVQMQASLPVDRVSPEAKAGEKNQVICDSVLNLKREEMARENDKALGEKFRRQVS